MLDLLPRVSNGGTEVVIDAVFFGGVLEVVLCSHVNEVIIFYGRRLISIDCLMFLLLFAGSSLWILFFEGYVIMWNIFC